jgi:hypothetical protein
MRFAKAASPPSCVQSLALADDAAQQQLSGVDLPVAGLQQRDVAAVHPAHIVGRCAS